MRYQECVRKNWTITGARSVATTRGRHSSRECRPRGLGRRSRASTQRGGRGGSSIGTGRGGGSSGPSVAGFGAGAGAGVGVVAEAGRNPGSIVLGACRLRMFGSPTGTVGGEGVGGGPSGPTGAGSMGRDPSFSG